MSLIEKHVKDEMTWESIQLATERITKVTSPTPVMTSPFMSTERKEVVFQMRKFPNNKLFQGLF